MNPSDNVPGAEPENSPARQSDSEDQPFLAKLVDAGSVPPPSAGQPVVDFNSIDQVAGGSIRVGSPFREDPPDLMPERRGGVSAGGQPVEAAYADYGPFLYTAMGASVSAVIVLFFDAAGVLWFPPGGALVAILGTILSLVGLFSVRRFRWTALAVLPAHVGLFVLSYFRTIS